MTLHEEHLDHVAVLTIDRPKSMNAINPELATALGEAWARLAEDDDVWVIVLTATGDRAFCAGADLKAPPPTGTFAGTFLGAPQRPASVPVGYLKPVVCGVNGLAYGGGLELMLSTDIPIAADTAMFALPEAKIGSIPGGGGTQRIGKAIPRAVARRMALTGEAIDARTALSLGLVTELVPVGQVRDRSVEVAQQICANAPLAVRAIKKGLDAADEMTLSDGLDHEQLLWGALRDSEDRLEGRAAFADKRSPIYRAR